MDIGNSRTKIAVFTGDKLLRWLAFPGVAWAEILEWQTNHNPDNFILSTVREDLPLERINQIRPFLQLNADTVLPFENKYRTPKTLGNDRKAAIAGAQALYPNQHCLVVDAGTCITMDLLTAEGGFLGGNISPGIPMRLHAMHNGTARLPLVDPGAVDALLGESTETALRNGGQLGAILELEGLIQRLEPHYDPLKCLVTGGDANKFVEQMKSRIFAHPDLVLYGLNKILIHNVEHLA